MEVHAYHTTAPAANFAFRTCAHSGCSSPVNKKTAKYCSVRCCSLDPARQQRLREQAKRAAGRHVLPMRRQLTLGLFDEGFGAEEQLAFLCEGREDVPAGLSRLTG